MNPTDGLISGIQAIERVLNSGRLMPTDWSIIAENLPQFALAIAFEELGTAKLGLMRARVHEYGGVDSRVVIKALANMQHQGEAQ